MSVLFETVVDMGPRLQYPLIKIYTFNYSWIKLDPEYDIRYIP